MRLICGYCNDSFKKLFVCFKCFQTFFFFFQQMDVSSLLRINWADNIVVRNRLQFQTLSAADCLGGRKIGTIQHEPEG